MYHRMRKAAIVSAVASLVFAAACGESGTTEADTRPLVRFVNATAVSSGGFTANGLFVAGSALASDQAAQTCSRIDAGSTSFGFGAANAGGTGLSGSALVLSTNETIVAGGSYTVVATGTASNPTLFVFSNTFSGELTASQAAVRFAQFLPPAGTTASNYFFYRGAIGTTPLALNMPFGAISTYTVVTSGANTFSVLRVPGNVTVIQSSDATLQAGSVNTMALVPTASDGVQLLHLARCS